MSANSWKLQDAKAKFSEVVRLARAGEPQQVTVHGQEAVVVFDPKRFELRPKETKTLTMANFIERSRKYRGEPLKINRKSGMTFRDKRREIFRDDVFDEDKS
jgi:prevent-host-death family protein